MTQPTTPADRAPMGILILMWTVVICSLGTIAYYFGDYLAARSELDVARRECQALEKQLPDSIPASQSEVK